MGQLPLAPCRGRADTVRARRCGAVGGRHVGANTAKEHHLVPKYWLRTFAEDGHVLGRWRSIAPPCGARSWLGTSTPTPSPSASGAWHWRPTWTAMSTARVRRFCAPCVRDSGRWTKHYRRSRWTRWPGRSCAPQAFRSFDEQVGRHLLPALWAQEVVGPTFRGRVGRATRRVGPPRGAGCGF
jgi:hypothetical protein